MARIPVIAGNWKMNKPIGDAVALAQQLKTALAGVDSVELIVCPVFTALQAVSRELAGSNISVGAQNVHWENSGAFTGEISPAMLTEIPVSHVIIGHSERRQYFGETDATVNQRSKAALAARLVPIVCVGESLDERQSGTTEKVVGSQLTGSLAGLTNADMEQVIVAYEPVWAIGTGLTATPEQAQEVHAFIRQLLRSTFGSVADKVRILYGGSVKASNAGELLQQADIDGALVGGASLNAADFAGIAKAVA